MDSSTPTPPYHCSNPSIADKPSEDPLPISLKTITKSPSPSPLRKSKTRLADRLEIAAEESLEPVAARRRRKSRESQTGVLPSPKKTRRPRKRSELEIREEKDVGLVEDVGKPRKRRQSVRSKKEKVNLVSSVPPSKTEEENGIDLDRVGKLVSDLIMWKDVSKSTLWFGFGSLGLLSSCFTKGLNFSIFSAISRLAIPFLGVSFLSNSIRQRNQAEKKCEFKLKEDDILRLAKLILPALNLAISKTGELFSGEPSMTLKVAPFLLLGAEYGHLITIWRLCAIGFFVSFTVPKLYSCYTAQINQRAECLKLWLLDTWCACTQQEESDSIGTHGLLESIFNKNSNLHCFYIAGTIQIYKATCGATIRRWRSTRRREGTGAGIGGGRNRGKGTTAGISGLGTRVPKLAP